MGTRALRGRVLPGALLSAVCVLAAAAVWLVSSPARALINLNYTPVDLVNQSEIILHLEIAAPAADGAVPVRVVRALQGKAPRNLVLVAEDAAALTEAMRGEARRKTGQAAEALLMAGDFSGAAAAEPDATDARAVGALHVGLTWFLLFDRPEGGFRLVLDDRNATAAFLDLKAVWAGSTRMLGRCAEYVKADSRADVPVRVGTRWAGQRRVATLNAPANGLLAVDLAGDGKMYLHVLSDGGDRLFGPTGDERLLEDVTAGVKLAARSKLAAWGDSGGDGRLDLVSSDGRHMMLHTMTAAGTFESRPLPVTSSAGWLGLAALDAGKGRASVLASGSTNPSIMTMGPDGRLEVAAVGAGVDAFLGAGMGPPGPCIAADFDADGVTDVVQPLAKGLLFYKGKAPGEFETPRKAYEGSLPTAMTAALAGDFDADGLPDLLIAGKEGCFLLHNGGGAFRNVYAETGEVVYLSKPNVIGAEALDINNDGRHEFLLLYPNMGVQPYFNRGFFCFGYAIQTDMEHTDLACAAEVNGGQQAGAAADFSGDGAPDLAVVTFKGTLWVLTREAEDAPALGASVALPPGAAGPVNVVGWDGKRCLGARVVRAGRPALFGKPDKGPLALTWQLPGGRAGEKQVIVLKPARFVLPLGSGAAQ